MSEEATVNDFAILLSNLFSLFCVMGLGCYGRVDVQYVSADHLTFDLWFVVQCCDVIYVVG